MIAALVALVACGTAAPPELPAPSDPCEAAWTEFTGAATAREALPGAGVVPSHDDVLAACRLLPEDARACFAPSWHLSHREDCDPKLAAVPKATRRQIDALLQGPQTPAEATSSTSSPDAP